MKISELIAELIRAIAIHGDIVVLLGAAGELAYPKEIEVQVVPAKVGKVAVLR